MAYWSETHGTLASCEDSTSKDTRQIFSTRYYVIKVHDQYNKDNFSSPTLVLQNQAIPGCSQHWMRIKEYWPYPRLFNLDESKRILALSQVIQPR
jgi:hypothetical protein